MARIDVHCHMFSKDVLTQGGKILVHLGDIITDLINSGDYLSAETKIERINAFIEMSEKKPSAVANALFGSCDDGSIIVPLMYDMYYLTRDQKKDFGQQLDVFIKRVAEMPKKDNIKAAAIKGRLENIKDSLLSDMVNDALKNNSFEIQRDDLIALKTRYDKRVYPFMSYDPRRSGNLDEIKDKVGAGKPFHGVKLYPPLGFSAAHPVMMDNQNGLYAWCADNDIPITAHCSCPGMPTLNSKLNIPLGSLVYDGESKTVIKMTKGDVVDFSKRSAAYKSQYFNHPKIWEAVLDVFPNLRLNLAHFGGSNDDWRGFITEMINSGKYKKLYTDVSCRTEPGALADIRKKYDAFDTVKNRLMFGSDFTILLLSSDITDFLAGVEKVFPSNMHTDLYWDNAKSFLNLD